MNAHTGQLIADSIVLNAPRSAQTVHVSTTTLGGWTIFGTRREPRHVVLVLPEGKTVGSYYECGDKTLARLKCGITPEWMGLDPLSPEQCEMVDNSTYWGDE